MGKPNVTCKNILKRVKTIKWGGGGNNLPNIDRIREDITTDNVFNDPLLFHDMIHHPTNNNIDGYHFLIIPPTVYLFIKDLQSKSNIKIQKAFVTKEVKWIDTLWLLFGFLFFRNVDPAF